LRAVVNTARLGARHQHRPARTHSRRRRPQSKRAASADGSDIPAIPVTVRQLEAVIRISESLAKMNLQTVASEAHVRQALELFRTSTMDAVKSGLMDVAVFTDEQRWAAAACFVAALCSTEKAGRVFFFFRGGGGGGAGGGRHGRAALSPMPVPPSHQQQPLTSC
jgi:hypothetical protein